MIFPGPQVDKGFPHIFPPFFPLVPHLLWFLLFFRACVISKWGRTLLPPSPPFKHFSNSPLVNRSISRSTFFFFCPICQYLLFLSSLSPEALMMCFLHSFAGIASRSHEGSSSFFSLFLESLKGRPVGLIDMLLQAPFFRFLATPTTPPPPTSFCGSEYHVSLDFHPFRSKTLVPWSWFLSLATFRPSTATLPAAVRISSGAGPLKFFLYGILLCPPVSCWEISSSQSGRSPCLPSFLTFCHRIRFLAKSNDALELSVAGRVIFT